MVMDEKCLIICLGIIIMALAKLFALFIGMSGCAAWA